LAKLAKFFEPTCVRRIFEGERLQFRHSDNSNFFFAACRKSGLPELFIFELTDLYDKKNIPKVIYCIHALSHYLAKKGIAPKIKNLIGQIEFTNEEIAEMENSLTQAGVALPHFGNVEGALAKELEGPTPEELRQKFWDEHTPQLIQVQSLVRGFLARKAYRKRLAEVVPRVIKVQSLARRLLARTRFSNEIRRIRAHAEIFTKLQAHCRGYLVRQSLQKRRDVGLPLVINDNLKFFTRTAV
jgi:hypothetical protein